MGSPQPYIFPGHVCARVLVLLYVDLSISLTRRMILVNQESCNVHASRLSPNAVIGTKDPLEVRLLCTAFMFDEKIRNDEDTEPWSLQP